MKRLRTMVLICFILLFVCGCQKESGGKPTNSEKKEKTADNIEGTYIVIENINDTEMSADDCITSLFTTYKGVYDTTKEAKLDEYSEIYPMGYLSGVVFMPENKFMMYPYSNTASTGGIKCYSGEYRIIDGQIKFDYSNELFYAKVPWLSWDQAPERIDEFKEGDDSFEKLKVANTDGDGTYYVYAYPKAYEGESSSSFLYLENYKKIPAPIGVRYNGGLGRTEDNISGWKKQYFTQVNEFLCTETAGMILNGSYEPGNEFSISYDFTAVTNDTYSRSDVKAQKLRQGAPNCLVNGTSTIHFTNNYWEWIDYQGDIIGKGTYTESSLYKGLIKYTDEEKKKSIFIYIDDSGQIWFPYMIKYNN